MVTMGTQLWIFNGYKPSPRTMNETPQNLSKTLKFPVITHKMTGC